MAFHCGPWFLRIACLAVVGCGAAPLRSSPPPAPEAPRVALGPPAPLFDAPDTSRACPPGLYNDLSQRCVPDPILDRREQGKDVVAPAVKSDSENLPIDIHEVTTAQYTACVAAGACTAAQPLDFWERRPGVTKMEVGDQIRAGVGTCNFGKPERADHPINCVTFEQAQNYCHWVGRRLPTGKEWVAAAAGKNEPALQGAVSHGARRFVGPRRCDVRTRDGRDPVPYRGALCRVRHHRLPLREGGVSSSLPRLTLIFRCRLAPSSSALGSWARRSRWR